MASSIAVEILELEEEVTNYLSLRYLTIQLFCILLGSSTILEGLHSIGATSIARTLLERGRRQRLPLKGPPAVYTWGMVIDLGISGLVYCATDI